MKACKSFIYLDELEMLRLTYGNERMLQIWESLKPKKDLNINFEDFIIYGTR